MKNTGIILTSLLGGMVVGAAVTMFVTPVSGPELRKQLKDYIEEKKKLAEEKLAEAKKGMEHLAKNAEKHM